MRKLGVGSWELGAGVGPRPRIQARGGFTLLEVLVSIFVLLFGLLAVAAVVPIAGLRIIQTKQADQATACGQSAMRDVKVRRMTEPRRWLWYNPGGSPPDFYSPITSSGGSSLISFNTSFAIDPLGFAKNVADATVLSRFPYDSAATTTMLRVTLRDTTGNELPLALADRMFTWHDDLTIPVPADPGDRPKAIADSGNNVWQIDGKYSWLATVTPEVTSPDNAAAPWRHDIDAHRTYRVSIVVFYNRDFSPPNAPLDPDLPGERRVMAEILGVGVSGGDVRLFLPSGSPLPLSYLDVKRGDWLMLCGVDQDPDNDTGTPPTRNVFRWYRVVSTDDSAQATVTAPSNAAAERYVTLAGPDWNTGNPAVPTDFGWCSGTDSDLNNNFYEVEAALFTRVIGVYTTTIEMDELGSLWGS